MIRSEFELCRTILDGMAGNVARATEEVPITISITQLMATILKDSQWCQRVRVTLSERIDGQLVSLSIQAVPQAVWRVLQNVLDASELDQMEVLLSAVLCGARLFMEIRDRSRRMTDQALARTGLTFMSTASLSHDAMPTRLGTCEFSTFDGSPTTNGSRAAVGRAWRLVDLDIDFIQVEEMLECETILPPARLQLERLLAQHEEAALFGR